MAIVAPPFAQNIHNRWLLFTAGLLLCSTGVWVLFSPFQSYLFLSRVVPACMIVAGILDLWLAATNRHHRRWVWWLLAGFIDLVIGAYLYDNSLLTILLLPIAIGLWTGFKGCLAIGEALHIRRYDPANWRRLLFIALTVIVLSAMLLACPLLGIENIFLFSGFALVTAGLFKIYWSFKLQNHLTLNRHEKYPVN